MVCLELEGRLIEDILGRSGDIVIAVILGLYWDNGKSNGK